MKCIYCTHKKTEVTNSRTTRGDTMVWRRRKCLSCKKIFTTREGTFLDNLFVIKRNGRRQRFIYEKLFTSIFMALDAGKERDNGKQAVLGREIAYFTVDAIRDMRKKTVTTEDIIRIVYKQLIKVNRHVADSYMFYSPYRRSVIGIHP
jgi:transcriptional repressor NrdR